MKTRKPAKAQVLFVMLNTKCNDGHKVNSFLWKAGQFSVMIGTLLYVFGSCERHSNLTEEMGIPLRPIPKKDSLRRRRFCELGN